MKAYTSLEQSKKLAEILPLESADMYYCYGMDIHTKGWSFDDTPTIIDNSNRIDVHVDIPCWSLAALFCIIPKRIKDFVILRIDIGDNDFAIWYDEIGCGVNEDLPDVTMKEPVDACCAVILKLHEQKYL